MMVSIGHPIEDEGAVTAHRYQFQYCCAAARLLAGIAAGRDCEVICEWHEDFLVINDGKVEAVSIKHREDHRPAWSAASIVSDGQLHHLMRTFQRSNGLVRCCFETNRDHTVGDLWSDDGPACEASRADLADRLKVSRADLGLFLDHTTITAPSVPGRHHIESAYATMYAAPALDCLGLRALSPAQAMRIAVGVVANASRDRIPDGAWSELVAAEPSERASVLAKHKLAARQVTTDHLREVLHDAAKGQVPRLDVAPGDAPPETTLTKKLEDGGLGPSVVDTARRRRRIWYSHTAAHRDLGDREAELRSLEEWVQDQANAAETEAVADAQSPYGPRMYQALMTRLQAQDFLPDGTRREDSNPALLSGAAFELTDACSVWWAPRPHIGDSDGGS